MDGEATDGEATEREATEDESIYHPSTYIPSPYVRRLLSLVDPHDRPPVDRRLLPAGREHPDPAGGVPGRARATLDRRRHARAPGRAVARAGGARGDARRRPARLRRADARRRGRDGDDGAHWPASLPGHDRAAR